MTRPDHERVGRFSRTSKGFGFVRPKADAHSKSAEDDIYISAEKSRDAADGDTVLVRLVRKRRGRMLRTEGEIISIVKRQTHQFVGTYVEKRDTGFVRVDGSVFPELIPVADARATRVQPDDRVVIEMVRFPSLQSLGEAVITEILGTRHRPGVDTLTIMREYNLPDEFPESVIQEARQIAERFDEEAVSDRRDFTHWTTITIDPHDARDFDDAVSLQRNNDGSWLLAVHIADVAHFVPENSLLDREARERGTSIYLPDRVIPMLPEIVSNHLASLQPHRIRFTRTALIPFTKDGERGVAEIMRSTIRSDRRFDYDGVDHFLANRTAWRSKLDAEVFRLLSEMHELAMLLRRKRLAAGSLEITAPKTKLVLDDQGKVVSARPEIQTESHQIIEEFMLAANMAVAEHLRDARLPFLRRIHEEPRPRKLESLGKLIRQLRLPPHNLFDRFGLKELLAEVAGTPLEPVINLAVLKSMAKAVYSAEPIGHYALGSECYCHFTSPIRRYPDLTIHRLLELKERGTKIKKMSRAALEQLGDECSDLERRAEKAERELTKLKLLGYFGERLGEKFAAVVTGVESYGLYVQCTTIPGEGLITRERLRHDYRFDRTHNRLLDRHAGASFQLGDLVEVEVARVDYARREIEFDYLHHIHSITGPTRTRTKKKFVKKRPDVKKPGKRRRSGRGRKT